MHTGDMVMLTGWSQSEQISVKSAANGGSNSIRLQGYRINLHFLPLALYTELACCVYGVSNE